MEEAGSSRSMHVSEDSFEREGKACRKWQESLGISKH
jgi:hypothetical protein